MIINIILIFVVAVFITLASIKIYDISLQNNEDINLQ